MWAKKQQKKEIVNETSTHSGTPNRRGRCLLWLCDYISFWWRRFHEKNEQPSWTRANETTAEKKDENYAKPSTKKQNKKKNLTKRKNRTFQSTCTNKCFVQMKQCRLRQSDPRKCQPFLWKIFSVDEKWDRCGFTVENRHFANRNGERTESTVYVHNQIDERTHSDLCTKRSSSFACLCVYLFCFFLSTFLLIHKWEIRENNDAKRTLCKMALRRTHQPHFNRLFSIRCMFTWLDIGSVDVRRVSADWKMRRKTRRVFDITSHQPHYVLSATYSLLFPVAFYGKMVFLVRYITADCVAVQTLFFVDGIFPFVFFSLFLLLLLSFAFRAFSIM